MDMDPRFCVGWYATRCELELMAEKRCPVRLEPYNFVLFCQIKYQIPNATTIIMIQIREYTLLQLSIFHAHFFFNLSISKQTSSSCVCTRTERGTFFILNVMYILSFIRPFYIFVRCKALCLQYLYHCNCVNLLPLLMF